MTQRKWMIYFVWVSLLIIDSALRFALIIFPIARVVGFNDPTLSHTHTHTHTHTHSDARVVDGSKILL